MQLLTQAQSGEIFVTAKCLDEMMVDEEAVVASSEIENPAARTVALAEIAERRVVNA